MAGNELIDGIGKLINYFIDIFSAILYSLFKPILSNPSNFGNEPSAYLGNLVIGLFFLIIYCIIIFAVYSILKWLLSMVEDKESIIKESICLSLTIEIVGSYIIGFNNLTFVKFLGDIIGLSFIFYVILIIITLIAEKID